MSEFPELPHFDVNNMSKRGVVLILSRACTSQLIEHLVCETGTDRFFGWFGKSSSSETPTYIPSSMQINSFIPLSTIIRSHIELNGTNNNHVLTLVYDDLSANLDACTTLREHLPTTKKDQIRFLFAASHVLDVGCSIQTHADYVFIGKQSAHHLDVIWQKFFLRTIPDYSTFYEMYRQFVSASNRFLVLDVFTQECYQFTLQQSTSKSLPDLNSQLRERLCLPYQIHVSTPAANIPRIVETDSQIIKPWRNQLPWKWFSDCFKVMF